MNGWSPPSLPRGIVPAVAAGYVMIAAYSVVIAQQLLLGVIVPGAVLLGSYLLWRALRAIEAIADALQRIADALQRIADALQRIADALQRIADARESSD